MSFRRLTSLACCCGAVLLTTTMTRADDDDEVKRTISVSGTGKISAVPDVAQIVVGVVTQAKTAQAALAENAEAMTRLHSLLKERGVAAKDIQTTQFQITPQYPPEVYRVPPAPEECGEAPAAMRSIVGFEVTNTVGITARQVEKLGPLLDALVGAGANQVYSLSFRVDKPEKLLDEARRRAVADAKRTAELLAGEAGVVLGPPVKIIAVDQNYPTADIRFNMAPAAPAPMMAAPTPIAAGEQELSVSVQVAYELRQPR